jgi:opacity protein-like surface antigen
VTGRLSILFALSLLLADAAAAQTISLTPSNPKHWDSTVAIGWLGGNKEEIAERWNEWYDTFATSVDVGRYWTPHLKTELGVTFTSRGDVSSPEQFTVPGQPSPVFFSREHRFGLKALNLSGSYQFLENNWAHPFIGAGVQLAWERHTVETPFPLVFGRDGRSVAVPPADDPQRTTFDPRPFLSGGAKFYVSEEGFIRAEIAAAFESHGTTRIWWRVGGGIDF